MVWRLEWTVKKYKNLSDVIAYLAVTSDHSTPMNLLILGVVHDFIVYDYSKTWRLKHFIWKIIDLWINYSFIFNVMKTLYFSYNCTENYIINLMSGLNAIQKIRTNFIWKQLAKTAFITGKTPPFRNSGVYEVKTG